MNSDDPLARADDIAEHEFEKQQESDARELLDTIPFAFLPSELQRIYIDVQELYAEKRYADSGAAWELFKKTAHDKGMI